MSIPLFNGVQPSHIMYNGVEAELYFNGEKIWPTGISGPRYEFMFSGALDNPSFPYGMMPMALQGIKVNDSLLPESAIIGASYGKYTGTETGNYGPDGSDGYKAIAADTASINDWASWKKVTFEYDNTITSVSWHTNPNGQGRGNVVSGVFSLRNNNANVFPTASGYIDGNDNNYQSLWTNYFSDGSITYTRV